MQHYGAPTRLVGRCVIGLYFAVRQNRGRHEAAAWMLDPWWLNAEFTGIEEVVLPGDPEILPETSVASTRGCGRDLKKEEGGACPAGLPPFIAKVLTNRQPAKHDVRY
jgi:hypothetical protein